MDGYLGASAEDPQGIRNCDEAHSDSLAHEIAVDLKGERPLGPECELRHIVQTEYLFAVRVRSAGEDLCRGSGRGGDVQLAQGHDVQAEVERGIGARVDRPLAEV